MTNAAMDNINVRRMVARIQNEIGHIVGMHMDDAKPIIEEYFHALHRNRGVKDFTVGLGAIVKSFTVNGEKRGNRRGVMVGGNDENGERITHTFLRNRRTAKKFGRGLIGMMVVPFEFTPIRPAQRITFTTEIKRG